MVLKGSFIKWIFVDISISWCGFYVHVLGTKIFRISTLIPLLSKSTSSCYHNKLSIPKKNGWCIRLLLIQNKRFTDGEICVPFAMFSSGFDIFPFTSQNVHTRSYAQLQIVTSSFYLILNSSKCCAVVCNRLSASLGTIHKPRIKMTLSIMLF